MKAVPFLSPSCRKVLSIAAFSLILSPVKANELYSQFYSFGDSISDTGNLKVPYAGRLVPLKFSDKTLYNQNIAGTMGFDFRPSMDGGNNFSVSGNSSEEILLSVTSDTPYVPLNLDFFKNQKQDSFFMRSHGQADKKAMYMILGGSNDVEFVTNDARTPLKAAQDLTGAANALHSYGARYIIMLNVPNLGETPGGEHLLGGTRDRLRMVSKAIDDAVLAEVQKSTANILYLSLYGLVKEVSGNPAAFGFVDLSAENADITCMVSGTPTGVPCEKPDPGIVKGGDDRDRIITGVAQKSLFWDGLHPSSAMHKIGSDYILSAIRAATEVGSLPRIADSHSTTLDSSIFNELALHRWKDAEPGTLSFFGGGAGVENQIYDAVGRKANDNKGFVIHAGLHYQLTEELKLGAALQGAETHYKPEQSDYKTNSIGGSLFTSYQGDRFFSNTALNYLDLDYNNKRGFHLGALTRKESSSSSGKLYGLTMDAGYALYDNGQLKAGPIVSASYHKSSVDGFTESGDNLSSMVFGDQELDFKNAAAGVFLDAINDKTRLGIQIDYNKDLNDDDLRTIQLRQKIIPRMAYLPADISSSDAWRMKVRVGHSLTSDVEVYGSYQFSKADDNQTDYQALQLGISWSI
ncbi:autotransporter domain-containing protein [Endozoicomonas sp. 8E]|uniref:autotransporter domain-containing protein n=1 Tax=Endozoicomonas sp. 8E TaxID=3035692 RepID=UPI00293930F1|nr:autotransporter domain-containing protein [Endozoicomonas sp. 8E]WOG28530.1 autotransporter domain-containing protein [Endozoicomonas sp. 8E]